MFSLMFAWPRRCRIRLVVSRDGVVLEITPLI
jgi:hypothetical protein